MDIKPANGTEGHLLYIHSNGSYVFRVYQPDKTFIDYDIHHCDMCVTINDPDAYFYRSVISDCLDHAPETLGLTLPTTEQPAC